MAYDQKELIRKFREFYSKDEYSAQIADIVSGPHGKKSLEIDYAVMTEFEPELGELLVSEPDTIISTAEDALIEHISEEYGEKRLGLHVRFHGFPEAQRTSIRYLRSSDVGKFLVIEALVKKASEVRPKMVEAAFKCMHPSCGEIELYPQEGSKISEPVVCRACERSRTETHFKLILNKSVFVDEERLEVQELPEKLEGGQQPQRIVALTEDDMAGILTPGDRAILYGILKAIPRIRGNVKSTTFDFIFQVNFLEKENKEYTDIEPSDDEIRQIEEIAKSGEAVEKVIRSIAPTVYGHDIIKKTLALQLFGGVSKEMPDGSHVRGDIHTLLVGDPGTAKSQMLRYISSLSPRGVYASGRSASAAGLTAAAVKDEGGDGRWTLEAGALVMADGGIACIDELDKMNKDDRSSMHEAMEQQTITVVKAGISATLKSRCAILGAANPKFGRFSDKTENYFEEIDLPAPLISRFDTIFIMIDRKNRERDKEIAQHILKGHRIGEKLKNDITDEEIKSHKPELNPDFLKKYVSYAKRKNPIMSDAVIEKIQSYYLKTREKGKQTVAITARHLEALVRMAEASARIRLSDEVNEKDGEMAIEIMDTYLGKVLGYDSDMAYIGESSKTRSKKKILIEILEHLFAKSENGEVPFKHIRAEAEQNGFSKNELEELLQKLWHDGTMSEKMHGVYVEVKN